MKGLSPNLLVETQWKPTSDQLSAYGSFSAVVLKGEWPSLEKKQLIFIQWN